MKTLHLYKSKTLHKFTSQISLLTKAVWGYQSRIDPTTHFFLWEL